jgi:hypothetical protein
LEGHCGHEIHDPSGGCVLEIDGGGSRVEMKFTFFH